MLKYFFNTFYISTFRSYNNATAKDNTNKNNSSCNQWNHNRYYVEYFINTRSLNLEYYQPKVILFIKIMQNSSVTKIHNVQTMKSRRNVTRTEKFASNVS